MKSRSRSERGNTLIIALLAIIVLGGASAAFLSVSTYRNKEAVQSSDFTRAFYITEAGVSQSIAEITADNDYDADGKGDVSHSFDGGSYSVTATDDGNDIWTITSIGSYNSLNRGVEVVIGRRVSNPFSQGVFGGTSVSLSGSHAFVDSYDSDSGSYADQAVNVDPSTGSTYANDNGTVSSNGDITAGGGEVYGNLTPGVDGEVVGSGTYVSGSTAPADEATEMPGYVYTPVGTSLGNLNSTCTLAAGTYRYDNILLASKSVVTLGQNPGDVVTIYVDGFISITGQANIIIPEGVDVIIHHGGSSFVSECRLPFPDIFGAPFGPSAKTLTVNVTGSGSVNPSGGTYPHNTWVELTATPASGWSFDHWSGNLSGSDNPKSIKMNANMTVTAVFVEVVEYTLSASVVGTGSVSKSPDQATYNSGTSVTLTATPGTGYSFDRWEGDLTGSSNPASITMNANKSVTAVFVEDLSEYTLTVNTTGTGSVAIVPDQATYTAGESVTLSASAGSGWTFDHWTGAMSGSTNPQSLVMDDNKTVTAVFVEEEEEEEEEPGEEDPDINLAGQGITNLNNSAGSLIIYSSALTVNLSGQADFTGVIYAPYAAVDCSGQGHFCGAIVGDTVNISGQTKLHYDEALANVSVDGNPGYIVRSWREFTPSPSE